MLKGIKVRIYPNEEQEKYISNLVGSCRFVYNRTIDFYDNYFSTNKHAPSLKEVYLNYKALKINYGFLREVHSKPLSESLHNAMTAYANFFRAIKCPKLKSGKLRFEKPCIHFAKKYDSCLFPKQAFRFVRGNRISIIKKLSDILFKCSKEDEVYLNHHQNNIRSITLHRKPSGKYICSILINDSREKTLDEAPSGPIGIDIGIKDIIVTSEGERIGNPRVFDSLEKKLTRADKKMSRCIKGSRRFEKARRRLARVHEKIANVRDNLQHQITTSLVRNHSEIYTEDLSAAEILRTINAARWFMDLAPRELVDKLEYKCEWYGRKFGKIDKFYPSSRVCSSCGFISDKKSLEIREWTCPNCGVHHDRDLNAAKNILKEGIKLKVGLGSPEPNARGQVNIGIGEEKSDSIEMPWMKREPKCSSAVQSTATEP